MKDITNLRSGKLVALYPLEKRDSKGYVLWHCKCDCGNYCEINSYSLRSGKTKSCGCLQPEVTRERNSSNGNYNSAIHKERLFSIWSGIYARTHYMSQMGYKDYGGRGIKMCKEWEENYFYFKMWALSHGYKDTLTIERLDHDGNYEPNNCTWIPKSEQNKNQRSNIRITYNNETHIASEWADIMGISRSCIYKRIAHKFPTERILKEWVVKVGK